ncbi:hypothetical protein J6590_048276 [Homalodisca vitripennis]|nr:hypothetical protein J6590_048276 [Homalodisca vitripennis]
MADNQHSANQNRMKNIIEELTAKEYLYRVVLYLLLNGHLETLIGTKDRLCIQLHNIAADRHRTQRFLPARMIMPISI